MPAEDDKKKKQASSKKSVKKKTSTSSLSAQEPISSSAQKDIEGVIKQAFLRFYDNVSLNQFKVKDLEHLNNIVSEYLQSFMIIGYDITGEKVTITHAKNMHDRDALIEHLRTTLLNIVNRENNE